MSDKIQVNLPVEKNGKKFWVTGAWNDGCVQTCVSTICNPDDGCIGHYYDCRNCPDADPETERELVELYEHKMLEAMTALKGILNVE